MPCSAGAWVGGYPKATLQGPRPPRDLGTARCSSLGHQHQLANLSLEQCMALPTVAWQPPHGPHRTCSPCRVGGHGAAGGGDGAMPAGATMPVRTPWALKSAAEPYLSPGQGRTQVPTWLKASLGAEAGYKAGRGMAGGRPWGVSRAPPALKLQLGALGIPGDPHPEPQHAPAGF